MRCNPFFGSDRKFDESRREECSYLLHVARTHVRYYRLKMRKDLITGPEKTVLTRIFNDLQKIIATGSIEERNGSDARRYFPRSR